MSCLIAILLYTGLNSGIHNRLVLAHDNFAESFRMTYFLNFDQRFPELDEEIPIIKTPTTYREAGTYFSAYCSLEKDAFSIFLDVSRQLVKEIGDLRIPHKNNFEKEDFCFHQIESKFRAKKDPWICNKKVSVKNLKQNTCDERVVVKLAYDRRISLIRGFQFRNPFVNGQRPLVRLINPIEIKNYVEGGQFIRIGKYNGKTHALAWFQGNLHLFVWLEMKKSWKWKTLVSNVGYKGRFIIDFLRNTNPQIRNVMEKIDEVVKEYKDERQNIATSSQSEPREISSHHNQKLQSLMLEIYTSPAVPAVGHLYEWL
ncbi:CSEP0336 putative effector protein [Blumeria hordei DH14]|uniref:CSEP0336 putative effector protein n=1 Tax=Blumeria graminis f. sp. hordei (strain DH14) TaxID=546991 RepID=N1J6X3_BLUG1|nr:CSEP0336 putative effector protein [Blumeria hordei DH14]